MSDDKRLRPLFLAKPGSISRKDILRAERICGICIIECIDPDAARFCEPPLGANLDEQARAALDLMRLIVHSDKSSFTGGDLTKWFVGQLLSWNKPPEVKRVPRGRQVAP